MKRSPLQKLKIKAVKLAIAEKLKSTPYCECCGKPAITAHHIVEQSRSNYLRCEQRNLMSVCWSCHFLVHNAGGAKVLGGVILKRGKRWYNKLMADAQVRIRDNQGYWLDIIKKYELY